MLRFLLLLVLLPVGLLAQPPVKEYAQGYQQGLQALQQKNYEQARLVLGPLTHSRYQNDLVPLAHYFYSVAAFNTRRFTEASDMLTQLISRYPTWAKLDEARYLLANVQLEQGRYKEAFEQLSGIGNDKLKAEGQAMKVFYLSEIRRISPLRQLNEAYPADADVARRLARLIEQTPSATAEEKQYAGQLKDNFGSDTEPAAAPVSRPAGPVAVPARRGTRAVYTLGVLLPFRLSELETNGRPGSNQFAIDMYEGMKLAVAKLKTEGINVELQAYDVANDADPTLELVNNSPFQQADVLIGPLYPESYKVAEAYSRQYGIPLFSPLATSPDLLAANPFAYLAQPSVETQVSSILNFTQRFPLKTVAIAYGSSRQDSLLALTYREQARRQGYQILAFQRSLDASLTAALNGKKIGHFLAAFSNRGSGPVVREWLNRNDIQAPVLLPVDAFQMENMSKNAVSGGQYYLYDPMFVDDAKNITQDFRQKYLQRTRTMPSSFAYLGYDLVLFLGRSLKVYGLGFPKNISTRVFRDQYTLPGFDYRSGNDNNSLTILQYDDFGFVPVK